MNGYVFCAYALSGITLIGYAIGMQWRYSRMNREPKIMNE